VKLLVNEHYIDSTMHGATIKVIAEGSCNMKLLQRGVIAPCVINLETLLRWVVSLRLRPLYPRDRTSLAIKCEAAWAPEPVCTFWRREKLLSLAGLEPRIIQPIAQTTAGLRNVK